MTGDFQGIKAVLFDMDGVLVDSKESNSAFFAALIKKAGYGTVAPEVHHAYFHTPLRTSLKEFLNIDDNEVERIVAMAADEDLRQPHLVKVPEGLQGILEALSKPYRLGVVTSRMHIGMKEVFDCIGNSDIFEVAIGYEDSTKHKPHPEPLFVALERLGIQPGEAVYVGDGRSDIDAAHAAGMKSIFLSDDVHDKASVHIRNFKDLKEVLL